MTPSAAVFKIDKKTLWSQLLNFWICDWKKLWSPSGVEPNEPIWRVFKEWSDWCRSRKMLSQLHLQESLLAQLVYGVPLLRCLIVSRVTCKTRRVRLEPWMEKREGKEEMLPKKGCRNFQSNNCRVNVTYSHVFLFTQDNLWMNEHHPPSLSTEGMYTYVCLSFFAVQLTFCSNDHDARTRESSKVVREANSSANNSCTIQSFLLLSIESASWTWDTADILKQS